MRHITLKQWMILLLLVLLITSFGLWLLHTDMRKTKWDMPSQNGIVQIEQTKEQATAVPIENEKKHGRLELNTAKVEELASLPGIGPVLAERIVTYRTKTPFKVVRDLKKVSGIGSKKFEAVKDLVYVMGE